MNRYLLIALLLHKVNLGISQTVQTNIEFAVSRFKLVNTTTFFKTVSVDSLRNTFSSNPLEPEVVDGLTTLYFDKSNKQTTKENAYYIRKIRFNQNKVVVGNVEDYYKITNKLKFSGSYYIYKDDDEQSNNFYQGECIFYEEDGIKSVRKYEKGQLQEERSYLPNGKLKSESVYNPNRTRKYFKEVMYQTNGLEKETIIGAYNPTLKSEFSKKTFFNELGEEVLTVELENNCPKSSASYYKSDKSSYRVILQDFSCQVNTNEWTWRGNQYFTTSYLDKENKYQLISTNEGYGFLTIPLNSDLKLKPFEFVAEFEKSKRESINEFGIVWQYQNDLNYSYFVINTTKKTFEINTKVNGQIGKVMIGIRPQIALEDGIEKYKLKLSADPSNNKYVYSVNDQIIPNFNKIPLIQNIDTKNFNFGYIYKSSKANEHLNLKKLECKLY